MENLGNGKAFPSQGIFNKLEKSGKITQNTESQGISGKCYLLQGSHSDWKTWKMGRHFPVREKSGNFEQIGKVRENDTKYWKIQEISEKYYL